METTLDLPEPAVPIGVLIRAKIELGDARQRAGACVDRDRLDPDYRLARLLLEAP